MKGIKKRVYHAFVALSLRKCSAGELYVFGANRFMFVCSRDGKPNTLNPINNSNLPQNHQNIPIPETQTEKSPADQDRPKAELVKQTDWQQQLPPDGVEVSHEEIERCYKIGSVVGDGNFAVVRECRVRGSTQTFAMKMVDKAKLQGRGHMIQNEIALLRSLAHPRLVQLLRSHHTDTYVYLLMELVTEVSTVVNTQMAVLVLQHVASLNSGEIW
uniref:Protein kinase domain-containing protein n=1 Tax=Astyanax mexicanus TaxID=7994 RepID=A0A3B1K491_ASTMX